MEIQINPEYEKILPKLSGEEFEALKASIKSDGQFYPIIINQKGVILDGHNRYHVCEELKIEPKIEVRNFDNLLDESIFVVEVNLRRRNLNHFQITEMLIVLEPLYSERAKRRMLSTLKKGDKTPLVSIGTSGKTTEELTQNRGISATTFTRAHKVIGSANEETKDKLRKGEWSINYAYEGYRAIDGVSDKVKRKALKLAFEKEEINPIELVDITKKSELAQDMIESRAPKDKQEALTAKYKAELYTPELNISRLEEELKVIGGLTELELKEVSQDILKTRAEAEKFAKECGGFVIGETRYWKMKIDPYKYKNEKVGES